MYFTTYFFFNEHYFFAIPIIGISSSFTTDQEKLNQIISTLKFLD